MCRYAGKRYKSHFVCFHCRKQFKRPPVEDVLAQRGTLEKYQRLLAAHLNPLRRERAERSAGTTIGVLRAKYWTDRIDKVQAEVAAGTGGALGEPRASQRGRKVRSRGARGCYQ